MRAGRLRVNLILHLNICLERFRQPTANFIQDNRSTDQVVNRKRAGYKAEEARFFWNIKFLLSKKFLFRFVFGGDE